MKRWLAIHRQLALRLLYSTSLADAVGRWLKFSGTEANDLFRYTDPYTPFFIRP